MKLLIIGGTVFLGRHLAQVALERGHEVTLFNRGVNNPELFPEAEKLRGDRKEAEGLEALKGREWDAVIDTCGYVPRVVRMSVDALKGHVGTYCFISSVSAYSDFSAGPIDENAPVARMEDATVEEVTGETYGPLKVLCEEAAEAGFPGRALIIRPGLIVGPHDPSDRFTYWPHRVAQGGEVLAPDKPSAPTQFIDVRDLAEWNIRLLEAGKTGVYNADGPTVTMGEVLEACKTESGSDARFSWVSEEFLAEKEVHGWIEVPLWIPESAGAAGHFAIDCSKAIADGLTYRPLSVTVRDTLEWDRTREGHEWRDTLKPEKERDVLAAWKATKPGSV